MGPFKVLHWVGNNAYKVNLPGEFEVSNMFDVADLSLLWQARGFKLEDDLFSTKEAWYRVYIRKDSPAKSPLLIGAAVLLRQGVNQASY